MRAISQSQNAFSSSRHLLAMALFLAVLFLLAPEAHASAGAGGGLPYEGWLEKVVSSISGPVAFSISMAALIGAGSALIFGGTEMNGFLKTLLYLVLVLALIVAARSALSSITGTGATIAMAVEQPYCEA